MIDRKSAAAWLESYVAAWKSYDPTRLALCSPPTCATITPHMLIR